jgi:hypothetical protein
MKIDDEEQMVDVSPNPTTTDFAIGLNSSITQPVLITITDMHGTVVHESLVSEIESTRVGEKLGKGIYILTAKRGNKTAMHRLIKK